MVQVGVWELPMVLGEALLIDGMSALLLIIFMAASREHVQSSVFFWLGVSMPLPGYHIADTVCG